MTKNSRTGVWLNLEVLRKHLGKYRRTVLPPLPYVEPSPIATTRYEEKGGGEESLAVRQRLPLVLLRKEDIPQAEIARRAAELHRRAQDLRAAAEELHREARQLEAEDKSKHKTRRSRRHRAVQSPHAKRAG